MWIPIDKELPEKSNKYFIRKGSKTSPSDPMVAIFIKPPGLWHIQINGTYWEIKGVKEWREIQPPEDK